MKKSIVFAVFVVQVAARTLSANAPASAAASAAPAGPAAALNALRLSFEIKNYNYYDLTKETCPKAFDDEQEVSPKAKGKKLEAVATKDGQSPDDDMKDVGKDADKFGKNLGNGVKVELGAPLLGKAGEKAEKLPWMKKKDGASFLQSDRVCDIAPKSLASIHSKSDTCKSIADVFRAAIGEVVRDVLKCTFNSPAAPSPAPASGVAASPAAFLQKGASAPSAAVVAAPAPATAAASVPDPAIFVTFSVGKKVGRGKSVIVEITFTDQPENGMDDVALAKPLIQRFLDNGSLVQELKAALQTLTGITAKFGKRTLKEAAVAAWNVKKCEAHVKSIVNVFSHSYTKEQVPMAMYNECTNFMTRMSFSHDHVLDRMDTVVCRKTTAKFAKHWDVGEKAEDKDFELMCVRACEAKYGKAAPQCHVAAGNKLAGKPL